MTKRILFVDDESNVLRGIERGLRSMRQEWELQFVEGGTQALEAMTQKQFDVVVSDMRMPGMDGAELLQQVRMQHPRTVRMVLSGQSDAATVLRAIHPTHQYLSKPCDIQEIKDKLLQALALRDLLDNDALKETVSRIDNLPSQPELFAALHASLHSSSASLPEIADIVARDVGMTAKILQLVNSSFFGTPLQTANIHKAVSALGLNELRTMVLSADLFAKLETPLPPALKHFWNTAWAVGKLAESITQAEGGNQELIAGAFVAGLLHDVGRLVLATACGDEYQRTMENQAAGLEQREYGVFGCTHAQVGGYLLGLWGLPKFVVEATAWHHEPAKAHPTGFCPLIAVHVAHACKPFPCEDDPSNLTIDEPLLAELGLKERLPVWKKACEEANIGADPEVAIPGD